MTNRGYENQGWLCAWLKHRVKHKDTVKNINFSWYSLQGKLVIADFPKLIALKLGNNKLSKVEFINCPKLKKKSYYFS